MGSTRGGSPIGSLIALSLLALSLLCGLVFGLAAQRGTICAVRGVTHWIDRGSTREVRGYVKCSLWVMIVAAPLAWIFPEARLEALYAPSVTGLLGGFAFGIGAAINGSCAFGTMIGLGSGNLSYLGTLAGMAAGFALQQRLGAAIPASFAASPLEAFSLTSAVIVALAAALCLRDLRRLGPLPRRRRRWSPERAAAIMGITGAILHAGNGSWAYTLTLERSVAAMTGASAFEPRLVLIALACLAGTSWGADRRLRWQLDAASLPARLAGGFMMGVGAAYVAGGNDALVLHGAPALSPHVLVAYPAMLGGIALALIAGRRLRARLQARPRTTSST